MISLGTGEALIENQKISGWNAYVTTNRLILFNDIGFGDQMKVLDTRLGDVESITSRLESPWFFYTLGILFCLSSLLPTTFAFLASNSMPFFWPVLFVPVLLWMGLKFLSNKCFAQRFFLIRLKQGKSVTVPETLFGILEKVRPIANDLEKISFSKKIRESFRNPDGKFDFQTMVERLLS